MELNLDTELVDLENQPIKDGLKNVTLGSLIITSMLVTVADDQMAKPEDKVRMFELAKRASDKGKQDFSLEEIVFIKARVGKLYGPLLVGRAYELLEPKEKKDA